LSAAIIKWLISSWSLVISLFVSVFKLSLDLHDRKQKRKSEEEAKTKADLKVSLGKPKLFIQNVGSSDANINQIWFDGQTWDDSKLFFEARPSIVNAGQPARSFKVNATHDRPYPQHVKIEYADDYSRKNMPELHEKEYHM
jgi:hypothetical protein